MRYPRSRIHRTVLPKICLFRAYLYIRSYTVSLRRLSMVTSRFYQKRLRQLWYPLALQSPVHEQIADWEDERWYGGPFADL